MKTHLLLDGGIIRHHLTNRMRLFINPAEKDRNAGAMLKEEFFSNPPKRWEARFDNAYPTIIQDPATKLYRLYYTLFIIDPSSTSVPLERRPSETYRPSHDRVIALAVAESRDGVTWVKPELGIIEFEGSTANNLVMMGAHGAGILLDSEDPDPTNRYKLVTRLDTPEGNYMGYSYSADGIHFTDVKPWNGPNPRADSHNTPFRDPKTGRFAMTTRTWSNGGRVSAISTSSDFENWSETFDVLQGQPPQHQIYSMPVFSLHDQLIGLPSIYHEGDRSAEEFDLVDCGLATAHDIDSWLWIAPDQTVIARGNGKYPDGDFDAGCIYAATPIEIDGQWWVYYFGGNGRHTGYRETSLGRAAIDMERLAGYASTGADALLTIGPFRLSADDFAIFADIEAGGEISWCLVDPENRSGPKSTPRRLDTSHGWSELSIGSDFESWKGRLIDIEFSVRGAELFAIRTSSEHQRFK